MSAHGLLGQATGRQAVRKAAPLLDKFARAHPTLEAPVQPGVLSRALHSGTSGRSFGANRQARTDNTAALWSWATFTKAINNIISVGAYHGAFESSASAMNCQAGIDRVSKPSQGAVPTAIHTQVCHIAIDSLSLAANAADSLDPSKPCVSSISWLSPCPSAMLRPARSM